MAVHGIGQFFRAKSADTSGLTELAKKNEHNGSNHHRSRTPVLSFSLANVHKLPCWACSISKLLSRSHRWYLTAFTLSLIPNLSFVHKITVNIAGSRPRGLKTM